MRLTKIKLAGFKSFVDPTTFHLPSNLLGVVGPNGCGKSNIIDAVRWVMGESSARSLRGESLADVIFNGSAARKPVGQATIELVFDNSQGKLGGAWAQYNEIAIKRVLSRDGQSSYLLNGARCRRRDITDIFLGTGLGPRSYAIIEQGMISRLIEAKPEELRVFLEEAAGISKYKERRRETEARIRHTRENLDRLTDLREELGRQLQHLQRQARAAEQYQRYRAEERRCKAELLTLRWRALNADSAARESAIGGQETALEARVAEQRHLEARLEMGRERQTSLTEAFNQAQAHYYAVGSEISRLEQDLAHQRELRQRQNEALQQTEQGLARVLEQIHLDTERLEALETSLREAEAALAETKVLEAQANAQLTEAETARQDWQEEWETFSRRASEPERQADVERTRIAHLERQLSQQEHRLKRLRLEQDGLVADGLEDELERLRLAEQAAGTALAANQAQLVQSDARIGELREVGQRWTAEAHELREQVHAARGRLASLHTLQEAALGRRESAAGAWLKAQGLDKTPRLAECLAVESGWERAAEMALAGFLEAVCVQDLQVPAAALAELRQGNLTLFDTTTADNAAPAEQTLLSKLQAPFALTSLLAGVRVAADLDEAMAQRQQLTAWQSLITQDGAWLGRDWLRVARDRDEKAGVLARERELQALQAALDLDTECLARLTGALDTNRGELRELERGRDALQEAVNQSHREQTRLQNQLTALTARLQQVLARRAAIAAEQAELSHQAGQDQTELQAARASLAEATLAMERLSDERQQLTARRERLRFVLEARRAQATGARHAAQRQALAAESLRATLSSTHQALKRLEPQRQQLATRQQQLATGLDPGDESAVREQLAVLLETRIVADQGLGAARHTLETQNVELRDLEQARIACERKLEKQRETLATERLSWREISVQRQLLREQLQELGADPSTLLAALPATAEEARWQAELERLGKQLQRLGAVNLAAVEEFAQLSERKRYLDAQNDDLVEALTTLENAIRRIDRDTRGRFKDTFEGANANLQILFPRLFGGGQAYLELVGEDMLDAGVAIMARPPGKRIGTIHLLSGGEKALTAVALIFALFQLNPAPFCMLDEVDAPLDEANIGRFGDLVREMSTQIQFIFITHNKSTMEIAQHLSGVTMHEPGVSHLVAVDVDEAVRLATA